jgi:AcrR family transcriptional regulator
MSTLIRMVRWEPGAKERLQGAAVRLFLDHGFEQTTVQDIAAAAGLTERTFFRHFADKREVLFQGQQQYEAGFVEGVRAAPDDATPLGLAMAAVRSGSRIFTEERRPWARQRQAVIDANPALQERESLKRVALADAITGALQERGVPAPDARLAAETGVTVFSLAFRTWVAEGEDRPMPPIEEEVLDRVTAVLGAPTGV